MQPGSGTGDESFFQDRRAPGTALVEPYRDVLAGVSWKKLSPSGPYSVVTVL